MRRRWLRIGFVAGYVLGTKAGRERYEDMRRAWIKVRTSEPVRVLEGKIRAQIDHARAKDLRGTNGVYAPPGYEAEFANLQGPGVSP